MNRFDETERSIYARELFDAVINSMYELLMEAAEGEDGAWEAAEQERKLYGLAVAARDGVEMNWDEFLADLDYDDGDDEDRSVDSDPNDVDVDKYDSTGRSFKEETGFDVPFGLVVGQLLGSPVDPAQLARRVPAMRKASVFNVGDIVALTKDIEFHLPGQDDYTTTFDIGHVVKIEAYTEGQEKPFRLAITESEWIANVWFGDFRAATPEEIKALALEDAEFQYTKDVDELAELGYSVSYINQFIVVRLATGDEHTIGHGYATDRFNIVKWALDRARSI